MGEIQWNLFTTSKGSEITIPNIYLALLLYNLHLFHFHSLLSILLFYLLSYTKELVFVQYLRPVAT